MSFKNNYSVDTVPSSKEVAN